LSLDGLAVGFGAAMGNVNVTAVIAFSLVTNALAILLGCYIGNKIAKKIPVDLSWLSGVILAALALSKLF
jgi:putative Mn2+ efflux pump MntP